MKSQGRPVPKRGQLFPHEGSRRTAWQRLAPLSTDEARALETRFKAAYKRIMDQVKLHVSAPVPNPGGGFGGGRPGGRPSGNGPRGPRPQGKGPRREDREMSTVS